MKDVSKMSERELRLEVNELRSVITLSGGLKCPPHDLVGRSDGTAKCADCGELADVTETGAAR